LSQVLDGNFPNEASLKTGKVLLSALIVVVHTGEWRWIRKLETCVESWRVVSQDWSCIPEGGNARLEIRSILEGDAERIVYPLLKSRIATWPR